MSNRRIPKAVLSELTVYQIKIKSHLGRQVKLIKIIQERNKNEYR